MFVEDLQRRAQDHLDLAAELRGALEGNQIEPHYQPIIDLGSDRAVGVEGLVDAHR